MTTTELLLATLDGAYHRKSWRGPSPRGPLRGVTRTAAEWRPASCQIQLLERLQRTR